MENKKKLSKKQVSWLLWGSLIGFAFGAALHFGFDKTGFQPLSIICATNESIWEHMKILFFGAFFFNMILYFTLFRKNNNFIVGASLGLLSIVVLIPTVVETYSNILGREIFPVDLTLSYIFNLICQLIIFGFLKSKKNLKKFVIPALALIVVLIILFVVFRFIPPELGIFIPTE